jgi:outer membrane protein W
LNNFKNLKYVGAIAVSLLVLQFVGVAAAQAQSDGDSQWIARLHFVKTWPGSDTFRVEDPENVEPPIFTEFWADGGNGFNLEVERMIRPNIGVYLGVTFANMKTNLKFERGDQFLYSNDRVDMRQWNLGGNYHFSFNGRADVYAGVLVSWVNFSSSTFYFPEVDREYRAEYDSELSGGLNAGIDFPVAMDGKLVVSGQLRYLFLALESDSGLAANTIDPLQGYIGVGYRF